MKLKLLTSLLILSKDFPEHQKLKIYAIEKVKAERTFDQPFLCEEIVKLLIKRKKIK